MKFTGWIKDLRVRKKILLIISINVFFTALMTIISHQSLNKVDEIKLDIVQVGKAASRQLTADMMHDALRADVYNAFLTSNTDASGKKDVIGDFNEHVGIFKTSLNELKHYNVDPSIIIQVNKINGPLNNYIKASADFINKALYTNYNLYSPLGKKEMRDYKITFDRLAKEMEALNKKIEVEYTRQQDLLTEYTHQIQLVLFILGVLVAIIALTLSLYVSKLIEKPILQTEEVLGKISSGEITKPFEVEGKDETAQMLRSLNTVVENLTNVTAFVSEVGKGNFEVDVEIFQNNGEIYESLHNMTDAIKANVEEDNKRNWTSEGLAKFVDITRDIQDIDVFYNNILSNLIRYVNANQGYLYVINDDDESNVHMEIQAVYAYGKQRYLEEKKVIQFKQGMVGQAWFDKEPLYFTEIPTDFVNITSGIGEATPTCVFIVPLMINEKVLGVLEIASFKPMLSHEKEFIVKLSETIASTVDSAKTNDRTRRLLFASQEAEQAMKAQEEEIRQNMEEMQATQAEMERMQRKMVEDKNTLQQDFNEKIAESQGVVNGINATMATIEFTPQGNVVTANENFLHTMKCSLENIVGKHHQNFVPADIVSSDDYKKFWSDLAVGIEKQGVFKRVDAKGNIVWLNAIYNPIKDASGKVAKVIKFATDITQKVELEAENKAQMDIINDIAIVSKTDLKGNIIYVNDEFLKWAKYTREEVMGQNHRMLKSGDQDDQIFVDMWKTISSGKVFRGEIKNKAKDGSFYWVDAIVAPIHDENGKPKEYIAQRFVINEQKAKEQEMQEMLEETRAQEEEIRQNMEEMTAIQEQMEITSLEMAAQSNIINSIAIVSKTDLKGNITYVNDEFLKWSKYTKEEVMGKNHRMLKSGDQDDQIFVDMWKTISSGKIFRGEIKNKAKDGSFYWVDAIVAPVLDSDGKPKEYIAQRFVINEQKEREAKLNELLNKK